MKSLLRPSPARSLAALLSFAACSAPVFAAAESTAVPASRPWPDAGFTPLTVARIEGLPEGERAAWTAYWAESQARLKAHEAATVTEKPATTPGAPGHTGAAKTKGLRPKNTPDYYSSAEARALADTVVAWQASTGGWTKGNDYTKPEPPSPRVRDAWSGGTFDNDSLIPELRFLANVVTNANGADPAKVKAWRESFDRGLGYVFAAQYPNGGFPQVYPLVGGYHDAVTFNDNAMGNVLGLLRDIAITKPEFAFLPDGLRQEAGVRFKRGVVCILAAQIREPGGRRTAWCQQHDPLTLAPCAARNFEPVATCTGESTALVDLLMPLAAQSPEVAAAVNDACAWFERAALHDVRWDHAASALPLVSAPGAPLLWARMYEIGTDRPVFGDRDRTIHYELGQISAERQHGYAWFGDWPATRLERWKKLAAKETAAAAKQAAADAKKAEKQAKAKE